MRYKTNFSNSYEYLVVRFINREGLFIETSYVGSQHFVLPLLNVHQACNELFIPMPPDEVRGELGAQLFERANRVGRQPAKPDSCESLPFGRKSSAHDLVQDPLKVHQGLERFQVIQRILVSIVVLHLQHSKFRR